MWEMFDEKQRLAFSHARDAAGLDDRDALVQIILARVLLYRGEFDECARRVDRALELNPNDADVLAHAGMCRAYLGDPGSGLALAEKAHRLSKNAPEWYGACAAVPLFLLGRYAEAAGYCARAPRAMVDVPAYLAASHALAGDPARAREALAMFVADFVEKITFGRPPEAGEALRWLEHVNPFRRAEHADLFARGLRLAGLEIDPDAAREPTPDAPSAGPKAAVFRREGELWTAAFDGLRVQLSEAKGFLDLAELLSKPDVCVHALDLAGRGAEPRGDAPALDPQARRELAARARALQEGIDEAEAHNDRGAAERGREELDKLVEALAGAVGLGGRSRRLGSAAERARTAVTWRIRNAIKKIGAAHPILGRHLENAVKTGTYCEYAPEKPVAWTV
jgi:tetratricopeptide (TPR) repeat protein